MTIEEGPVFRQMIQDKCFGFPQLEARIEALKAKLIDEPGLGTRTSKNSNHYFTLEETGTIGFKIVVSYLWKKDENCIILTEAWVWSGPPAG